MGFQNIDDNIEKTSFEHINQAKESYQKILESLNNKKTAVNNEALKNSIISLTKTLESLNIKQFSEDDFHILETIVSNVIDIIDDEGAIRTSERYNTILQNANIEDENQNNSYSTHVDKITTEKYKSLNDPIEALVKDKFVISIHAKIEELTVKAATLNEDTLTSLLANIINIKVTADNGIHKLTEINSHLRNILIFINAWENILASETFPPEIFKICNDFSIAIESLQSDNAFGQRKDFKNIVWELLQQQYQSLMQKLKNLDETKCPKIKSFIGGLSSYEFKNDREKICDLLLFIAKLKNIVDKNNAAPNKEDVREFIKYTKDISSKFPKYKVLIDDIKLELFPDLEKYKKQKEDLKTEAEQLRPQLTINLADPEGKLQQLNYTRINDEQDIILNSLKGKENKPDRKPEHVKLPRATRIWINNQEIILEELSHSTHGNKIPPDSKERAVLDNVITFDYTINVKNKIAANNSDNIKVKADFDCLFQDRIDHFVIIEKNIRVEDSSINIEYPMKSFAPFVVVGVYNMDGTLKNRYVQKEHVNLANQMILSLKKSVNELPIDISAIETEKDVHTVQQKPLRTYRQQYSDELIQFNSVATSSNLKESFGKINVGDKHHLTINDYLTLIDIISKFNPELIDEKFVNKTCGELDSIVTLMQARSTHSNISEDYIDNIRSTFDEINAKLNYELAIHQFTKNNQNILGATFHNAIKNLDPTLLEAADYRLLNLIINESNKFPKINPLTYNHLIQEVLQSGIGKKTKTQHDVMANNPLTSAMLAILVTASLTFVLITCLPIAGSLLSLIGLEYCISGAIATTATSLPFGMHLKRWSPLYDAMQNISEQKDVAVVSDSSDNHRLT